MEAAVGLARGAPLAHEAHAWSAAASRLVPTMARCLIKVTCCAHCRRAARTSSFHGTALRYQVGCGCEQSWLHCQSWRCSRLCWLHLVGHGRRRGIQALLCEPHPRFRSQSHGGAQQRRLEARIIQTIEKNANETAPSLVSLACVYENGIALTVGPPLPTSYRFADYLDSRARYSNRSILRNFEIENN